MIIKKNEKEYTVKEQKTQWKLSAAAPGVEVEYNISKEICKTVDELKQYVQESDTIV